MFASLFTNIINEHVYKFVHEAIREPVHKHPKTSMFANLFTSQLANILTSPFANLNEPSFKVFELCSFIFRTSKLCLGSVRLAYRTSSNELLTSRAPSCSRAALFIYTPTHRLI